MEVKAEQQYQVRLWSFSAVFEETVKQHVVRWDDWVTSGLSLITQAKAFRKVNLNKK